MAKPKGGTLAALWEVSDRERRDFFERIQKREPLESVAEAITGTPETTAPETGVLASSVLVTGGPDTDTSDSGIPDIGPAITRSPSALPTNAGDNQPESQLGLTGIPVTGATPILGIPTTGTPVLPQLTIGIPIPSAPLLGTPISGIPITHVRPPRKIHRATQVQDGHSLGEHLILTTLWKDPAAVPAGQSAKQITIGYRTLSDKCRLTVNNCKANLRSLQQKLAIEAIAAHSNTQATTYLVYDFSAIMRRREAAGLTHVIRSKGCLFVHPDTGEPVTGIPVSGIQTAPISGIPVHYSGTPEPDVKGVPDPASLIRNKNQHKEPMPKERSASAFSVISTTAAQLGIIFDDDAVRRLAQRCRERDSSATDAEIAHFLETKVHQLKRSHTVGNWVGLLITSVPEFFDQQATELERFRQTKAAQEKKGREAEDQMMGEARKILDDPHASESDKAMARTWLSPSEEIEHPKTMSKTG